MPQEDFMQRQFDQLGKVLSQVLSKMLRLSDGNTTLLDLKQEIDETFKHEFEVDTDTILYFTDSEVVDFFSEQKQISVENSEKIANIFFFLGQKSNDLVAQTEYYKKALVLLEHTVQNDSMYSYERHIKIQQIKHMLASR